MNPHQFRPDRWDQSTGMFPGPHDERRTKSVPRTEGVIHGRHRCFRRFLKSCVSDNSNHLVFLAAEFLNLLSQDLLLWPKLPHKAFIHQSNLPAGGSIARRNLASGQQRNPHGPKTFRSNVDTLEHNLTPFMSREPISNQATPFSGKWRPVHHPDRLNSG